MPSPNMPLWHADYLELKLLEKQLVCKKAPCPSFPKESRNYIFHGKDSLSGLGGREINSMTRERKFKANLV